MARDKKTENQKRETRTRKSNGKREDEDKNRIKEMGGSKRELK